MLMTRLRIIIQFHGMHYLCLDVPKLDGFIGEPQRSLESERLFSGKLLRIGIAGNAHIRQHDSSLY
jgi:hemin uptake protein HemP